MCEEEFDKCSDKHPISWNSKCKWFTDNLDFLKRVSDGSFNNSKFKQKYTCLIVYDVVSLDRFKKVSTNELMLMRKDQPCVGIKILYKIKCIQSTKE